ncbi:ATP-binding protein [Sphingobacterium detergens]|uniref:Novel STAND NTPase 3 domain-containing protein n=1 Tax=Sphingobacterium detergens TaxID=1145106 RepID=A0A420ARY4_SPHD1|nr:ATP-binding protein [Sphingobacterium detergens]RKE47153.1 hypothetical protein DFQ12_4315 [Sphingobacterium detergens]
MNSINWSNFNSTDFTLFCNSLLTFEFGNNFTPFSAPGKDGGIDGKYVGIYGTEQGSWRFQYKFHQVARKQAYSILKSELKNEIKNLKDEDYFVLLTNVELLPQELVELNQLYESESSAVSKNAKFKIWDGAKLFALYVQYPLLELWINEGFLTAQLQHYRDFFKKEMQSEEFEPRSLNNVFIAREKDLEDLNDFLSSEYVLTIISGEAGIGKTRLVVEFFEKNVSNSENWVALVLAVKTIQIDKIRKAISSKKNTVILIDDAHKHHPETISDLKRLADSFNGRVKLILTVRTLQAFESLELIKEYEQEDILKFNLKTLSREDTKTIFESYLKNTDYRYYINDLVVLSYGRPILIVAVLKAISEGVSISKIREGEFLKNYVLNYFYNFYTRVADETKLSKLKLKRLLQNIALIEPFNYDDSNHISKLSEVHEIGIPEIKNSLKTLLDFSFVSGRFEHSIKPDYYSDILLMDVDQDDATEYITQFDMLLDNIIFNLSSVDEVNATGINLLDDILNKYISRLYPDEKVKELSYNSQINFFHRIFTTIRRIVFVRPQIAMKVVDIYLECIKNEIHPIAREYREMKNATFRSHNSIFETIVSILRDLNTIPKYYSFVLKASNKLFNLTGDKDIPSIYNYSKQDVINQYKLSMQTFFMNKFMEEVNKKQGGNLSFFLEVVTRFLNLDFTSTENSNSSTHSLIITTYYLPETPMVKELRLQVINTLVGIYQNEEFADYRKTVLALLLDIPRMLFATERNKTPFRHDEEHEAVLNFIEDNSEKFGIADQKEIFEKLHWYIQWKIPAQFIPQIERINKMMEPKNLAEDLGRMFNNYENGLKNYSELLPEFEIKISEIIENFTGEEVAKAIYEFLEAQLYPPIHFYEFLRLLVSKSSDYGLSVHDFLLSKGIEIYQQYADTILNVIYFEKKEEDNYWNRIEKLESLSSAAADNVILSIYGRRVPGTASLSERDIQTILKIYNKKDPENNFQLASGLQTLITADYPEVYTVIAEYLDRTSQRSAEMFFLWLSDNKIATPELVKELVTGHSVRFNISHQLERVLAKVLKDYGPDTIFEYLVSRYNFKYKFVSENRTLMGYEFVPNGDRSSLFNGQNDVRETMFFKALDWYLKQDASEGQLYYAKDIFEYLQPENSVSDSLYENYVLVLTKNANDLNRLKRIAESLEIFHTKNEKHVALVLKGYELILRHDEFDSSNKAIKDATFHFYRCLTSHGVKSGPAGQPFQVDLDLKRLLESELNKIPEHHEGRELIIWALESVNNEINRSESDNDIW